MKELIEFRIFKDYYHLLPPNNAKLNGIVHVLNVPKGDVLIQQIEKVYKELRKNDMAFFSSWQVKRYYTKNELVDAKLFHLSIKVAFEPTGEECGTLYDETAACEICGANRKQVGLLKLKKGTIPKKDITRTIAGEVVVSEKFARVIKQKGGKGILLKPILFEKGVSNYYQLTTSSPELELAKKTVVGQHPFDLSNNDVEAIEFIVSGGYKVKFDKLILKCPKEHLIGSKLISEPYVLNTPLINNYDFFVTKQKLGAKQGLLCPEPLYLCSKEFRKIVLEEKLSGFDFEIAHIEEERTDKYGDF
jgi:hypothetical protein